MSISIVPNNADLLDRKFKAILKSRPKLEIVSHNDLYLSRPDKKPKLALILGGAA